MKSFRDESGQTLVLTALCMTILIGCMAIALDVSLLFRAKRKVQIAADAAAIAAGLTYYHGGNNTQITAAANNAATANGITNINQVTVNLPPANGSHTGTSYVEVVIKQPNATSTICGPHLVQKILRSAQVPIGAASFENLLRLLCARLGQQLIASR